MKFQQIRELVSILIVDKYETATGIAASCTLVLSDESLYQLEQDIYKEYAGFTSNVHRVEGRINKLIIGQVEIQIELKK